MPKVIPEDYSVDMRTVLAKERTLLSHQGVQLTKIGISMGVFASGLAIVKLLTTDEFIGMTIAGGLMALSLLVGGRAYLRYQRFATDLDAITQVEEKMAHGYRKTIFDSHEARGKKNQHP